jgi:LacI family transcriptional regulator, galactose operon repressor
VSQNIRSQWLDKPVNLSYNGSAPKFESPFTLSFLPVYFFALEFWKRSQEEALVPLTLEKVAKKAGVSRSTVSRVLNNDPHVSAKARARVLAVTQKLNFQPNLAARSLAAGGSTRVIGLVIPMGVTALFTDPYFPLLIQGVASACNAHDYSVMLWLAEPEYERRTISQILYNGLIDGVILASMLVDDSLTQSLIKSDFPFVVVGRHPTNSRVNFVDVDNISSARQIVTHLMRLGYRRVATIAGPANMIAGADRFEGYRLALCDHGITADPGLIVPADFTEEGGYTAMQKLLPLKPDAVFVASDTMAVGALRALRDANVRVPEDISVAGFDDMPSSAHANPPLTTMRQPVQRTGATAAETLIGLIANPRSKPTQIVLPTELIIRESCGAGKAKTTSSIAATQDASANPALIDD